MKLLNVKDIVKVGNTFTKVTNCHLYDDNFKVRAELTRKDGKVIYPEVKNIIWNGKQWILKEVK